MSDQPANKPNDEDEELRAILRRMREQIPPRPSAPPSYEAPPAPPSPPATQAVGQQGAAPDPHAPQWIDEAPPARQQGPNQLQLLWQQAPASITLLAINIVIYLLTIAFSNFNLIRPDSAVLQVGWKQNDLILQGEYWRLVSAMFLHGDLAHIFFNGFAIYSIGPLCEQFYRTKRYLVIYFLAGIIGSLASYALNARPAVGASGAIFGVFGALAVFFWLNRQSLGAFGRQQLQSMAFLLIINLAIGFSAGGTIDNNAHIGGLVGGALAGWLLAPRIKIERQLLGARRTTTTFALAWPGIAVLFAACLAAVLLIQPPL